MHVKNWSFLDLKQRRQVMAHIQAQRAMHAKEIFLKELAAVGGQYKAKQQSSKSEWIIHLKKRINFLDKSKHVFKR